jgi:3-(3-hydroxy-phenyl)propionate hydroxylase
MADGGRLDDAVGYGFALLVDPAWRDVDGERRARVVPAASPALRDWLDRLDARAVLLRPDRYVAGVARDREGVRRLLRMSRFERSGHAWA